MKTCEFCFKERANILYYESLAGRSRHVHLCPTCSETKGFDALDFMEDGEWVRLMGLKVSLERSVLSEDFEEAARLRDTIRDIERLTAARS